MNNRWADNWCPSLSVWQCSQLVFASASTADTRSTLQETSPQGSLPVTSKFHQNHHHQNFSRDSTPLNSFLSLENIIGQLVWFISQDLSPLWQLTIPPSPQSAWTLDCQKSLVINVRAEAWPLSTTNIINLVSPPISALTGWGLQVFTFYNHWWEHFSIFLRYSVLCFQLLNLF